MAVSRESTGVKFSCSSGILIPLPEKSVRNSSPNLNSHKPISFKWPFVSKAEAPRVNNAFELSPVSWTFLEISDSSSYRSGVEICNDLCKVSSSLRSENAWKSSLSLQDKIGDLAAHLYDRFAAQIEEGRGRQDNVYSVLQLASSSLSAFGASKGKSKSSQSTPSNGKVVARAQAPLSHSTVRGIEEIQALFDDIDRNHDGQVTEGELRAYAGNHGLPTTYVREFLDLARYGWRKLPYIWQKQTTLSFASASSAIMEDNADKSFPRLPFRLRSFFSVEESTLGFDAFKEFVEAKDAALAESFRRIDVNGDGQISPTDLENGFQHVRVMCGKTGVYKRVRRGCIDKMIQKVHMGGGQSVSFKEFRDFFTLLPSSDYLLDYWLDASCCAQGLDVGSNVQVLARTNRETRNPLGVAVGNPLNHLLAGGLAGAISRTATAPLETLRLKMMVSSGQSMSSIAKHIFKTGGWKAFFKGNMTNVVRSAPQKAIDFYAFEAYKNAFSALHGGPASLHIVSAGALAGATSSLLLYPLDVIRSRLTVQSAPQFTGIIDAFLKISSTEGLPALYKGLRPSIVSIIPEAAITYGCFDLLKKAYKKAKNVEDVGVLPALGCGVTSAFTGQLVAYPLELVARRLQVGGTNAAYKGMGDAMRQIIAQEGVGGLYRGIVPASLKVIPMAIVSFGVYESAKGVLMWITALDEKRRAEEEALQEERDLRAVSRVVCGS